MKTPVEIDTALAEALYTLDKAEMGFKRYARQIADRAEMGLKPGAALANYERAMHERDAAKDEVDRLNNLYTGWRRYWHVTNANGHVHTSQHCTSCFPTTEYAWRTDLSGLTPEEVVAREAYRACTVCMPIAPAEQRAAYKRYTLEQHAAKQAERNAKAADKAAKAVERASKHFDKVQAWITKLGGLETFKALGYRAVYDQATDAPSTVFGTLLDLARYYDGDKHGLRDLNEAQLAEAKARGLV